MNFYEQSFNDPSTYLQFLELMSDRLDSSFSENEWKTAIDGKFLLPDKDKPKLHAMADAFVDFLVQQDVITRDKNGLYRKNLRALQDQLRITTQYIEDQKSPIFR